MWSQLSSILQYADYECWKCILSKMFYRKPKLADSYPIENENKEDSADSGMARVCFYWICKQLSSELSGQILGIAFTMDHVFVFVL